MYPYYFANEYILLEHELGRTESLHRYWRPSPTPPPLPVLQAEKESKSRSVSTRSSRSSIKTAEVAPVKSNPRKTTPVRASELETTKLESTLSCLASLFQGMYTTTLCRLMME